MKLLIIQGHPDNQSFTHQNAMNYYEHAKQMGIDVEMVDLSTDQFDPVLRYGYRQHMEDESYPKRMQKLIQDADHLAFFFPVWWSAEPSVLKGWIDRVLTPHFAYHYQPNGKTAKLLTGKTADVFSSSHGPGWFFRSYGSIIFRWKYMILGFCGIKVKHGFVLGKMGNKQDTPERREQYMQRCAQTLNDLQ